MRHRDGQQRIMMPMMWIAVQTCTGPHSHCFWQDFQFPQPHSPGSLPRLASLQVGPAAKRGLRGTQVYAATWGFTKVAVKRLVVREGSELRRLEAEQDFLNEIEVMSSCSHQNLVNFYSACIEPEQVCALLASTAE